MKTPYRLNLFFFLFLALPLFHADVMGQKDLNADLPIDPRVKVGKLKNGLTYYIRENQNRKTRLS